MNMSGKTKKVLAILGAVAVGILGALVKAMPDNHTVHAVCEVAIPLLGALGFTFPVSIKAPDAPSDKS